MDILIVQYQKCYEPHAFTFFLKVKENTPKYVKECFEILARVVWLKPEFFLSNSDLKHTADLEIYNFNPVYC